MNASIGTEENKQLHHDILFLFKDLLAPFMQIERDIPFAGSNKKESDAEHVFSLSMIVLSIEERLGLGLDRGLLAQYALIHDLVEAYAGDVSAKAAEHLQKQKQEDEAKALKNILRTYEKTFPWIGQLCKKYEEKNDKESKFVYAIDKCMGAYTWLAGDLQNWHDYYPKESPELLDTTVARLRTKAARSSSDILALFDSLHELLYEAVKERNLR